MSKFVGAGDKDAAKKALREQRPCLVLFYMIGCPHCEANKPAWEDAKAKAPKEIEPIEVEADATPDDEDVQGFPTMMYIDKEGKKTKTSGEKSSGDEILKEVGIEPKKKGGSRRRRRRTHRIGKRKLLRRTLRNYVGL